MMQQEGRKAPDIENMKPQHWDHVLDLPSKSARVRYYQFLWQNEMRDINKKATKERKKIENEIRIARETEEEANNDHINYGMLRNTMFLRIYDSTINHFHNAKLVQSMMFEPKLVFDCSYDQYMNPREASNAGKQLMLSFAENRFHDIPFDLHFCGANHRGVTMKILEKFIPTMHDASFPMRVHQEPVTEMFDKSKLVYLTPHCHNDLVEYNPDDIYIVGAMVDKTNNEPLSLAKAKKHGLRMARLPLDRYLTWSSGSGKSLTLNQMVLIMLELKRTGDWRQALKYVPRRKVLDESQTQSEEPRHFQYERPRSVQNPKNQRERFDNNFDNRRQDSYRPRQNYDRQQFDGPERSEYRPRENFNRQQVNEFENSEFRPKYNNNQRQRNSYTSSSEYQPRQNFNNRRADESFDDEDLKPRSKERKHFDKFQFDLDTWGSKMNQRKNNRGDS